MRKYMLIVLLIFGAVLVGHLGKTAATSTDLVANVSADKQSVTITFASNPPITFNTEDLEKTIDHLGHVRAVMQPAVPSDFSLGQVVGVIPDPRWATEPERGGSSSLLHIWSPNYGWLHFLLPPGSAADLGRRLVAQSKSRAL
jgi:hypothetical protein